MMRMTQVALVAALTCAAGAAQAQVLGIPFYPTPTGTGASAAADYGDPDGTGKSLALTGGLGLGRLGFTATVGTFDAGGAFDRTVLFGATAGMKLFGGGLNPISIGAQVGYGRAETPAPIFGNPNNMATTSSLPVGINIGVSPPLFPLKPFAVAYYQLSDDGAGREARVTIGANFNLLLGLGFHGAYDAGDSGNTWGVGAHFNFRMPGLPGM